VKYALSLLGLMPPDTRLPLVELDEPAKAAVARALAAMAEQDLIAPLKPDAPGFYTFLVRGGGEASRIPTILPAHHRRCADRPDRDLFFRAPVLAPAKHRLLLAAPP
jgi:hypothetical protein